MSNLKHKNRIDNFPNWKQNGNKSDMKFKWPPFAAICQTKIQTKLLITVHLFFGWKLQRRLQKKIEELY